MFSWAVLNNLGSQGNFLLNKIRNIQLPEFVCVCKTDCNSYSSLKYMLYLLYDECQIWNLKEIILIFKGLVICTPWQLCESTTAHNFFFFLAPIFFHHLWTDLFSVYLSLPLNHSQIQHTVLNATKHKPSWCFFFFFFKSRASYPHAVPFPWETLRLPDSVPSLSFTFKVAADRPECKLDGGGLHSLWALINGDSEGFWGLAVTQG